VYHLAPGAHEQVGQQVAPVAQAPFDIVAEDPEIEHVAQQVQPAPVKKVGANQGEEGGEQFRGGKAAPEKEPQACGHLQGDGPVGAEKLLQLPRSQGQLVQEDQEVDHYKCDIYYWKAPSGGGISDGDHPGPPFLFLHYTPIGAGFSRDIMAALVGEGFS